MARRGRRAKTRTVTRRRRRLPSRKKVGKSIGSQWGKISKGAGVLAFLSSLLGRISGYTPFKNAAGANTPQTIGIDGIFNKWSGIGLASTVYGMLPLKMLPHKGKAKTLGKSLLTAGILSGIFMPTNNHSNLISPSRAITVASSEVSYT